MKLKNFTKYTVAFLSAIALGTVALTTAASADETYTVKSGDTLSEIEYNFKKDSNYQQLAKDNNIANANLIYVGQQLLIKTDSDNSAASTKQTQTTQSANTANTQSNQNVQSTQSSQNTQSYKSVASTQQKAAAKTQSTSTSSSASYTGSNLKSYVLSQMSSRTGVSASTWNAIIQRESNWQPSVRNSSSGAYGLFQNMHISSGSVQQQVDAAVSLYKVQGMGAWALN